MTKTKEPRITPASYLGALLLAALGTSALINVGSVWCGLAPLLVVAFYTLVRGFRRGGRDLCRHAGLAFGLAATAGLTTGLITSATAPVLTGVTIVALFVGMLMVGIDELLK